MRGNGTLSPGRLARVRGAPRQPAGALRSQPVTQSGREPTKPLDVGAALRSSAAAVLASAQQASAGADKAVAIHNLRKAMKHWRALLRLLAPWSDGEARALRHAARDLGRVLGPSRDATAALDALADLDDASTPLPLATTAEIRACLQALRSEAERRSPALDKKRAPILATAAEALTRWPLDDITFPELARRLEQTYAEARKLLPEEWEEASDEALHDLRRRVVEHRYQMALVEPLWPRLIRSWTSETQKLREQLGAHHDLAQLEQLAQAGGPVAAWQAELGPLIAERKAAHLQRAAVMAGRLFADRPRDFRRWLERVWRSHSVALGIEPAREKRDAAGDHAS